MSRAKREKKESESERASEREPSENGANGKERESEPSMKGRAVCLQDSWA